MILEAVASMFASISLSGSHPRDPAVARMLGMGTANTAGVTVTHEKVMALPAIKRAVQIITDKMFGMPWYVFREEEDGRTWDRTHPAWRCVHLMANRDMDAPSLRQLLVQYALRWGNGCAYIDRESDSGNIELLPLLPDRTEMVRVTADMAERINDPDLAGHLMIRTRIGGDIKWFDYSDVLHIKGLGDNPYWGWDLTELMTECFAGAMAKDEFSNRFFSNGANPVGFITMDGSLDEESEETYMQSLAKGMQGLGKAHKLILLEEGAKFTPVTIDPQKSQMLEGKQFDIRLLAMAIGIKVHKLVDGANSAFASLEQANHEHKDDDILPWVNKLRVQYDRKLLSSDQLESGSHSIDVDDETLDWVPFSERARGSVDLYNNGLITKDEGRRKVNFGPSKASRAKDYRIPANIVYEDDAALIPPPAPQQPAPEPESKAIDYSDVADAYLDRIEKRVIAQAKSKAKTPKDFITWLDALKPEDGPQSIQPRIDELYSGIIKRLNELAETKTTAEELANAI
jgi:HK97 family phage portal protein